MTNFFDQKGPFTPRRGRVEGRAKVTGKAKYSAEYDLPKLAYGVMVGSTIAAGRIRSLQLDDALAVPGVIDILSYWNKPSVPGFENPEKREKIWITLPLFFTDTIYHNDQYIALVVAETLEDATYAASLVQADYEEIAFSVDFKEKMDEVPLEEKGTERGSFQAWQSAPHIIDEEYTIAMEVHNPMEPHATLAHWEGPDKLTLYDKNQGVNSVQRIVGQVFDMPGENIHVISEFVGGGFGAGLRVWPHTIGAAMAARQLDRPVKVVLTRPQMFTQVGFRPESWQRIVLGADREGKFLGTLHQSKHTSSELSEFSDGITRVTRKIYGFEHVKTEEAIVPLHIPVPTWMRGPGDASGCFAMESAIDQLCYEMSMDPVEIRLKNIAPYQMETGNPWSSHYLNECIERGARQIGWDQRPTEPATLREGDWLVGYGHAVGLWNAGRGRASASAELSSEGILTVRSAMTDIGTGTGQGMLNVAHNRTGMPRDLIRVEVGNSALPRAGSQGGSTGMASVSAAVVAACEALFEKIAPFLPGTDGATLDRTQLQLSAQGVIYAGKTLSYRDLMEQAGVESLAVEASVKPGEERDKYGFVSSAAHFCKVRVHPKTGRVKIERFVSVADGGKIINEKAAANQIIGAVMGGIGMALLEKQEIDHASGRLIGNDFAGYHFAVNASAPIVEVSFINKPDPHINPSGAKGIGEVGLIGNAAAIANAIYNATGKRLRDLPITPDRVLMAERAL